MSAERLAVERMALATDPLVRLQMAGINPEVVIYYFSPVHCCAEYTVHFMKFKFTATQVHGTLLNGVHSTLLYGVHNNYYAQYTVTRSMQYTTT